MSKLTYEDGDLKIEINLHDEDTSSFVEKLSNLMLSIGSTQ